MTASSTLLALFLMPLCLWIYSRHWINTAVVQLLPLGAVSLTLGSTLLPIGLGVLIRYRHPRAADIMVKVGPARGVPGAAPGTGSPRQGASCPSKPVRVSHGHRQLPGWDTEAYSLEIKRWDRESEGRGGLPLWHPVGIPDPAADAFHDILLSHRLAAPRSGKANLQARPHFLKTSN